MYNDTQFLFKKYNYKTLEVKNQKDIEEMEWDFAFSNTRYFAYDTETTGLNFIKDIPFLVIFGFDKNIYYWDANYKEATYAMFKIVQKTDKMLFAHNAKYDYHMLHNIGTPIPDDIELSDSITLFRLISSCDDDFQSMRLEKLGEKYVDPSAKFAGHEIKKRIEHMKAERKKMVCNNYKALTGEKSYTKAWETFTNKVRFITKYHECFDDYKEPGYYDVYLENPELVKMYAIDDVVIILEFLNKAGAIYAKKYWSKDGIDTRTWKRENKLIRGIATMERNGFKVDVDYLVNSHYRIEKFRELLYDKLHELTHSTWKVGQHVEIKKFFHNEFGLDLEKSDKKAIQQLTHHEDVRISEIAKLIIKLRTVDKWLSTYIDGVLNKIVEVDGEWRLYTSINNNGAVSGRVSCDLQQMPKYAINETDDDNELLLDESVTDDDGVELFHPRKFVIPSTGYKLYFEDYSQMELRIQAYYTILVGHTDYNLCRAYMPYDCKLKDGTLFDYKNPEHIKHAYDWEWFNHDGTEWEPTDLHTKTTLTAFPEFKDKTDTKEFKKKWRYLGKSTNFAKNYGCGAKTLASNLNIDLETATKLSDAYNSAYPGVIEYQKVVQTELNMKGYVTNLYGRRYYLENSTNFYKANNYLIQGTGADALKEVEIKICDYLKDKKSRFILPIHDELAIEVHPDEESFVPQKVQEIMQSVGDTIKWIPMLAEVEATETNWAEKKEVNFD
mgnify:CR=1 FL=1